MVDPSAVRELPNNGALLTQGPSVPTSTPSAWLSSKNGTPRKTPSSAGASVSRQVLLQRPHITPRSAPCGQVDEDFLVSARHVDAMVHAIHSDKTEDHAARLEQAYKDLSGGLDLSLEASASSKPKVSEARLRDFPPAVGVVPGIVDSPRCSRSQEKQRKKGTPRSTTAINVPWGPERANQDHPPWEQVLKKKEHYCKILDQQNADKSDHVRAKTAEERAINRSTRTSFQAHQAWGLQASDGSRERAIHRELLATVDCRKKLDKSRAEAEKKDGVRVLEENEKWMAWQWHVKCEEGKREKERLSKIWKSAAKDRRKVEEAQNAAVLREEKEIVRHTNQGMLPDRRLRRPKEACVVAQDAMPLPYWAQPGFQKCSSEWNRKSPRGRAITL